MDPSTHPGPNTTGTGHINSFNPINSHNTITNITYGDERVKLLNWLSPLQPRVRHNDVRSRRQDGIGEWFLQTDEFLRWRDGEGEFGKGTLFCSGNPGVGKTFLSSVVIDRLLDHFVGENIAVVCLYCDFQDQEKQTAANMIGALAKQLVNALKFVPTEIKNAFAKAEREVGGRGLQVSETIKLLQAALAPVMRTFICIDALDECPDKHRFDLLTSLHTVSQASPDVRLFITGRPHIGSAVKRDLPAGAQVIPISPNTEDIREYLEMELRRDWDSGTMSAALKADIMKRIPEKIPDAFLLVSLSIAAILAEATIHKRRERLEVMTNGLGLDGAYDATLDRIKGQGKGKSALAMAALMWISHSERPMRIGELCDALAVEIGSRYMECDNIPSEKTLLASCLGLVTVDESSTVRLVHFTLQEYFNSHSEHFENPQSTMAEVCLTYLNFDSVNELSHSLDNAPVETQLLQYASSYWGRYARNGLTEGGKSLALQLLSKFGRHISAKLLLRGESEWGMGWQHSVGFTSLHCAAYIGLDKIAISLLDEVEDCGVDTADGRGRTPLVWAAESGHEGIVKILLDRKEVNPDSKDNSGQTPLQCAAEGGHEGIVKLLLDQKEVNPESRDDDGKTPLWCAAEGGHEEIVKLLLYRKEVNPESRDKMGRTPLHCAARGGNEGIGNGYEGAVKLLLGREEVNPDPRDDFGKTPLWCAAWSGHSGIVKLLLDRKEVNSNSRDHVGKTPLWCAAFCGHEGVAKLLLGQKELNPDPRDDVGKTPLWFAVFFGHEGVAKLLLDRREVNPNWIGDDGRTPLYNAALEGHEGITKLLLDRKEINPDLRNKYGITPLQCAARFGHDGVVKLLLDRKDVNPDMRAKGGRTPLSEAALGGQEGIVKLEIDLKVLEPDMRGRIQHVGIAEGGHEEIVKLLLSRKEVDPNSRDDGGRTPLWCAALGGHEGIVKLLLGRKEVDPDSRDDRGRTPFWCAAEDGYEGIVKLLLDRKEVNPDSKDQNGRTPLHCAAEGGHEGVVKQLLNRNEANPDSKDNDGRTPLWCAAKGGHEGIVKLLLNQKEVEPDSKNNDGRTPLWCAAECGSEGVVKQLLGRKEVNPDSRDDNGRTPLVCAAEGGHEVIVGLLQRRADAEPGTGATNAPLPPSHLLETSYERLAVSQPLPQPPKVASDMLTQNTHAALSSAVSPPDTSDTSADISPQAPPLDSPPLALPNPAPRTCIAILAAAVATLAIKIKQCL